MVPPSVVSRVDAEYPPEAAREGLAGTVVLFVTVEADGSVGETVVEQSASDLLDAAALRAIAGWRFEPAKRDGVAVSARIRVPFTFAPPVDVAPGAPAPPGSPRPPAGPPAGDAPETPREVPTSPSGGAPQREAPTGEAVANEGAASEPKESGAGASAAVAEAPEARARATEPVEVTVRGHRELREEERSVGNYLVDREVLSSAPRQEGAEVLRSAPGVYIGRGEGAAVAHSYMLRGFDAEHGQDIEFRVADLPINLPSHIHGQGYADLGFLIGDVVSEMHVAEGVYDPRQGDFAVAGSIHLELGVDETRRGIRLASGYGAFDTFRQLVVWAPPEEADESFGAAQYTRTSGFGRNRAGQSASGILQHRFGEGRTTYRLVGLVHGAEADMAGVVRRDDVAAGRVCFLCVYPYPTARAQGATARRGMVGFFVDYAAPHGANGQVGLWVGRDDFRLTENFTGFIQRSRTLADVSGRGDLIEQVNGTSSLGITGRYRTSPYRPTGWTRGTIEVGLDGRADEIEQTQSLLDASVRNQIWDHRVDASVRALDLGLWGDLDWGFSRYVRTRLGARADVLSYDIDDRLGNFVPATRDDGAFVPGFRRSAFGVAAGPRASVEVRPVYFLALYGAYGEGYRSPQARTLEDGESAPFVKVRSVDLGPRLDLGDPLQITLGGYYTHLSDDVAFDAEEGRLSRLGASQRLGAVLHARSRPLPWLIGAASVTYVDATLLEPPPPTAEEPQPPFVEGQRLPFVPPVVGRLDLGARGAFLPFARDLRGRLGTGLSYLSPRPLPYGSSSESVVLLDASAGLDWSVFDLTLDVFNLLDESYGAVEYNFASDWDPSAVRPRTPARHTSAGAPMSWMITLGVTL